MFFSINDGSIKKIGKINNGIIFKMDQKDTVKLGESEKQKDNWNEVAEFLNSKQQLLPQTGAITECKCDLIGEAPTIVKSNTSFWFFIYKIPFSLIIRLLL